MQPFLETLSVLLAGAGLFILGWLLLGRLATPVGATLPVFAVVPACGNGAQLEHNVRGLLWLRGSDLARFTVVIADCGLDEEGRALALLLTRREPDVLLCPADQVDTLLAGGAPAPETAQDHLHRTL